MRPLRPRLLTRAPTCLIVLFAIGAAGCQPPVLLHPLTPPDTCNLNPKSNPPPPSAVGQAHLVLVGPGVSACGTGETCSFGRMCTVGQCVGPDDPMPDLDQNCLFYPRHIDFAVTPSNAVRDATGYTYTYQGQVTVDSFLPAATSEWVLIPPKVVADNGVVSALSYVPTSCPATGPCPQAVKSSTQSYVYTTTTGETGMTDGSGGWPSVPVARLVVTGAADQQPPQLNHIDAGMALVQQGGTQAITASVSDGQSGLVTTPTTYFQPLTGGLYGDLIPDSGEVALFGLYSPAQARYYPLWPLTQPSQTVSAVVPGLLPPGQYQLYGQARDRAGNQSVWQGLPNVPPTMATYVKDQYQVCVSQGNPVPSQQSLSVPLITLIVASVQDVDQQPPTLNALSIAGATGTPGTPILQPCQEITATMSLSDNVRMPTNQQAMMWLLPLSAESSLMQVPAYPVAGGGNLQATFILPADAPLGRWLYYPAYAVDAANNALVGAYQPGADGAIGSLLLGNQVNDVQTTSTVPPGEFCLGSCDPIAPDLDGGIARLDGGTGKADGGTSKPDGGTAVSTVPEAATLTGVSFLGATGQGNSSLQAHGGDVVQVSFSFHYSKSGALPSD